MTEIQELCDKVLDEEKGMETAWDGVHEGICLSKMSGQREKKR